jgi:hypothetical protein
MIFFSLWGSETKRNMRDCLFRSAAAGGDGAVSNVKQKITRAVQQERIGHVLVDDVLLMGAFDSIDRCAGRVEEALFHHRCVCLITGNLNYLPHDRWKDAHDIDFKVYVHSEQKKPMFLKRVDGLDMMITYATDHEDVLQSLHDVYPVARHFYLQREYPGVVERIEDLKKHCIRLGIKSDIVPAFKGFVIAAVAIANNESIAQHLRSLQYLHTLTFTVKGEVKITLHADDSHVSEMIQHRFGVEDNTNATRRVRVMGNASVRRGITHLMSQCSDEELLDKSDPNILIRKAHNLKWKEDVFDAPSDPRARSRYLGETLELFSTTSVFVVVDEQKIRVYYDDEADVRPDQQDPTESVSFWKVAITAAEEVSGVERGQGIADEVRPRVPPIETHVVARAMAERAAKKLPLITRSVEPESGWPEDGLCLCHSVSEALPNVLTFQEGSTLFTFEKNNKVAYHKHMQAWFDMKIDDLNDEWYKRFATIVKLIHASRSDWYAVQDGQIQIRDKLKERWKELGPTGATWSVRNVRARWKTFRQHVDAVERDDAQNTTTIQLPASAYATPPRRPRRDSDQSVP